MSYLVESDLKHGGPLRLQRPLSDPAAIMVIVDSDHLKKAGIGAQLNAISLMEAHDGPGFRVVTALPLKNREIVRHERYGA